MQEFERDFPVMDKSCPSRENLAQHFHITSYLLQEKFDDDELNEMLEDLKTFKDFQ